ncbi:MAG TPA: aspartate/glutamate racemase family protein [Burkholderiales bacterium]|nr:aspartate/glutamate racemase family protein [Burkholderiales bacterium]
MNREPVAVGLMVPGNNTTMEPELLAWLPEGSCCRTLRIPRGQGTLTPADLPEYVDRALSLAAEFVDEDLDLIVYGCTAAGFMGGPARDAEVAAQLAKITGKRVITTAGAMVCVLEHIGARKIAVITPYLDLVNERIRAFLAHSGISVEILSTFNARTVEELAAIQSRDIADRARDVMQPGIDALFIACSQLPTHAIIADLERELGIPVWSSIRATAWQALRSTSEAAFA